VAPHKVVSISVPGPWICNKPVIRDTHKKNLKKPHFLIDIPEELPSFQFSSQSSGQRYATALLAQFRPVTWKILLKHRELESEHTVSHWASEPKLQHNQNLHYKYTLWNPNCSQIDTGENTPYPFSQFREEKIPLAYMSQMWKSADLLPGQGDQAPLLGSHIALHWPETAALATQTRVFLPQKTYKISISHSKSFNKPKPSRGSMQPDL
jgi:hypothetical protein